MLIKIENNLASIDNYKQICSVASDLIVLEEIKVKGNNLKIKFLDKNRIVIVGVIKSISIGDD
jgi:hypothetical protein